MYRWVVAGILSGLISGCTAIQTVAEHHELEVETKMSRTIFLEPVEPEQKVVWVEIRNTSDQPELDQTMRSVVEKKLISEGWRITASPQKAYDLLQVNIKQVTKTTQKAASNVLKDGFGGALVGGIATDAVTKNTGTSILAGVVTGVVSMVADAAVTDVTYVAVADIQLSRRYGQVKNQQTAHMQQGEVTKNQQTHQYEGHWLHYQARMTSQAEQVNLTSASIESQLIQRMSQSISGLLG